MDLTIFPKPDAHGNYWFGSHNAGPAIFPSKRKRDGKAKDTGSFIVLLRRGEFLYQGAALQRFDTAAEALEELRARIGDKS